MTTAFPGLVEAARVASDRLRQTRERARRKAIRTLRAMEISLVEALDGELLRGLPELWPGYHAVRVRGVFNAHLPQPRPFCASGREVLVVEMSGELRMACGERDTGVDSRPVEDDELLVEDVEEFAAKVGPMLAAHVERARRTAEKFGRVEQLADRIAAALLGE